MIMLMGVWLSGHLWAASYTATDGRDLSGEPIGFSNKGLVMKLGDGSYSPATPWAQLSQETLKALKENPKARRFVEPFIQLSVAERESLSGLKLPEVSRLDRPTGKVGIFGMLFSSGLGWFLVLLVYLASLFAAYEVALYRAYSPQVVCGLAAVLPWISQAVLLAIPRAALVGALGGKAADALPPLDAPVEAATEPSVPGEVPPAGLSGEPVVLPPGEVFEDVPVPSEAQSPLLPDTVTYSRGVVTFNRRFFESKTAKFAKLVPPEDARDFVLLFRTSRGNYTTNHISKLDQGELFISVAKGNASESVKIPYLEIYEVQVKHKDVA